MDSKLRFSDRACDYALYRPSYPAGLIDVLASEASFAPGCVVADVGAGTGKLSALFADRGAAVCCIEPNPEMLHACISELGARKNCHFIRATAERTGLVSGSVDIVSAGQSFHWFDVEAARTEFLRVLHPDGCVFIVWNTRDNKANPFMIEYGKLLEKHASRGAPVLSSERAGIEILFGQSRFKSGELTNWQTLDLAGLIGRLASSSYLPSRGSAGYDSMLSDALALFKRFEINGRVQLLYRTEYFIGRPESD